MSKLDDIRHLVNRSVECINDCDMGVVTSNIDGVTLSNCAACEKQELEQAIIDYYIELVGDDEKPKYESGGVVVDEWCATCEHWLQESDYRCLCDVRNEAKAELRQKIREE